MASDDARLRSIIRLYKNEDWSTMDRILSEQIDACKNKLEQFDLDDRVRCWTLGVLHISKFFKSLPGNIESQIDVESFMNQSDSDNETEQSEV